MIHVCQLFPPMPLICILTYVMYLYIPSSQCPAGPPNTMSNHFIIHHSHNSIPFVISNSCDMGLFNCGLPHLATCTVVGGGTDWWWWWLAVGGWRLHLEGGARDELSCALVNLGERGPSLGSLVASTFALLTHMNNRYIDDPEIAKAVDIPPPMHCIGGGVWGVQNLLRG